MRQDLRRYAAPAYIVGFAALLLAGLLFLFTQVVDLPIRILLVLGVLGALAGVVFDPDRLRRMWGTRQARYGSNSLLVSLSAIGVVAVLYVWVGSLDLRWDLSEDRVNTLAPESEAVVKDLRTDVLLMGFYTREQAGARESLRPLLQQYRSVSGSRVTYQFVDPNENPLEAERYGVTADGTLVVVAEGRSEVISFPNEQQITAAILRLSFPEQRHIFFLTGHGEAELGSSEADGFAQAMRALQSKNYTVEPLNLLSEPEVPDSALAIVLAGPRHALTAAEIGLLEEFQGRGGGLVMLLQPSVQTEIPAGSDPLVSYLENRWGIRLWEDVVVDLRSSEPLLAVGLPSGDHPITSQVRNLVGLFPLARGMEVLVPENAETWADALVTTGPDSWGETDLDALETEQRAEFDESEDQAGPIAIAAVGGDVDGEARLVVFGDSNFATNNGFLSFGNGDLFVNSIDWAAHQDELINLTPRERTQRVVIPPTQRFLTGLWFVTLIVLPGSVLALGAWAWWSRRRRG